MDTETIESATAEEKPNPEAEWIEVWQSLRDDQIILCKDGLARLNLNFEKAKQTNAEVLAEFDRTVQLQSAPLEELSGLLADFIPGLKSVYRDGRGFSKVAGVNDLGSFIETMKGIISEPEKLDRIGDYDWDYIADIGGKIVSLLAQIPDLNHFLYQKFEAHAAKLKKRVGTVTDVDQTMPGFIRSYEDLAKLVNEVIASSAREANRLRGGKLKFLDRLAERYDATKKDTLRLVARTLAQHLDAICNECDKELVAARRKHLTPVEIEVYRALFSGNYAGLVANYASEALSPVLESLVGKGLDELAALKIKCAVESQKASESTAVPVQQVDRPQVYTAEARPLVKVNLPHHEARVYSTVERDICRALGADNFEGLILYSGEEINAGLAALIEKGAGELTALKVKYSLESYLASLPSAVSASAVSAQPTRDNGYSARLAILETVLGDKERAAKLIETAGLSKMKWPSFNAYVTDLKKQPVRSNS